VDKHLQVVGHPHIFAVGDVTDVPEEKLAFLASQQGNLVATNISALAAAAAATAGGDVGQVLQAGSCKLRSWTPSAGMQVMFVSIGRK
jgi:NADH dehydrogenase FAD-containing subunit